MFSVALDEWAVLDALSTLVDRSLVEVSIDRLSGPGTPRYRLLDNPRAYALDRLRAAGEEEQLRRRHANAIRVVFGRVGAEVLSGKPGVDASEEALQRDLEDGQVAVAWAVVHEPATALDIAAQLCLALGPIQGEIGALRQMMEEVLDASPPPDSIHPAVLGEAALQCARWTKKRPKRSLARAQQALIFFRSANDRVGCYQALAQIAKKSAQQSDLPVAQESLKQMRELESAAWPPSVRRFGAEAEYCVCASCEDHEGVRLWLQRQFDLNRAAGANNTQVLVNLACSALNAGRIDEAISRSHGLIEELAGTRHQYASALAHCTLIAGLLAQGSTTEARQVAQDSWALVERFDMRAAWADLAALLAALEGRTATAVKLVAYADVAYAATNSVREISEQHSVQQALRLAHVALDIPLGLAGWDRLKEEGAALREQDVAALALEPPYGGKN